MDKKIIIDNTLKVMNSSSSERVLLESFVLFKVKKGNFLKCLIIIGVCVFPSYMIGTSKDTINLMGMAIDTAITVLLAFFGVFFTGYVLFQAMINSRLLLNLLQDMKGKKSSFEISNTTFIRLMMIYLTAILLSVFVRIFILSIPEDWMLINSLQWSNRIAIISCEAYFYFISTVLWEAKTFIYNISLIFKAHAATRVQEIIENDEIDI